jgi:hypothetical protein
MASASAPAGAPASDVAPIPSFTIKVRLMSQLRAARRKIVLWQ